MKICKHLTPILDHELIQGNSVAEYSTTWANVKLLVDLKNPIDVPFAQSQQTSEVKYWKNTDGHYALQEGLICNVCHQAIAGLLGNGN